MSDPRPDLLSALPGIAAARIAQLLPDLAQCDTMAGRLDLSAVTAVSIRAPAVLVSRLGIRAARPMSGTQWHYACRMAAFAVTRHSLASDRDWALANIVQVLMQLIPGTTWRQADPGIGPAEAVEEEPLTLATLRKAGLSVSAVVWTQPLTLTGWPLSEPIPMQAYAGWEPRIGAAHEEHYDQIGRYGE